MFLLGAARRMAPTGRTPETDCKSIRGASIDEAPLE
jgi:hypothetical protein